MKNKISKIVCTLVLLLGIFFTGCSSFDDKLEFTAPPTGNETKVRIISGEFTGKKFTVKVEGQIVATDVAYGKLTTYVTAPTGAKNFEFVDQATNDSYKFDIGTLADGSFIEFRPLGLGKRKNYTFILFHPIKNKFLATVDESKFLLKIVLDNPSYGLPDQDPAKLAIIRPILIYDNRGGDAYTFQGITTNDIVFDGRKNNVPMSKIDFYGSIGDPTFLNSVFKNDNGQGMYNAFDEKSTQFVYFSLRNDSKEQRFKGVQLKTGSAYTIVCSGSVNEADPTNPLTVTLYSDNTTEAPIVLKKLATTYPAKITENRVFNFAYGLSKYGSFTIDTGGFNGIRLDAYNASSNFAIGKIDAYPGLSFGEEFKITPSLLRKLQDENFTYKLSALFSGKIVLDPALDSFQLKLPKSPSVNIYLATDKDKKTVLFALPNDDYDVSNPRPLRVVNLVPDATIQIDIVTPETAPLSLFKDVAFGNQSAFAALPTENTTIIVKDASNNELARLTLDSFDKELKDSGYYDLISISGTADPSDDIADPTAVLQINKFYLKN